MQRILLALVLVVVAILASSSQIDAFRLVQKQATGKNDECSSFDQKILMQQALVCKSFFGSKPNKCCPFANTYPGHASGDWPRQTTYVVELLQSFADPSPSPLKCLNSSISRSVVSWLTTSPFSSGNKSETCSFFWTWKVFQFQYFDIPRKPGVRIESADTLGEKSWSNALLKKFSEEDGKFALIEKNLGKFGMTLGRFASQVQTAIPESFKLSARVQANCFLNKTFDPARNGTCRGSILMFGIGFDTENVRCLIAPDKYLKQPDWFQYGY